MAENYPNPKALPKSPNQTLLAYLDDKVSRFLEWKDSLVSDPNAMGGAETFPDSRLTVRHIGAMVERGVDAQEILEDYPYLKRSDLEFACIFVKAYSGLNDAIATMPAEH